MFSSTPRHAAMECVSDAMDLALYALVSRVAAAPQQQFDGGVQCQPSSASLPPTARLQGEPFSLGFVPELLLAIMAQLLKCLVVQHSASSFPHLWDVRVDRSRRMQPIRCSQISPSFPFRITGTTTYALRAVRMAAA